MKASLLSITVILILFSELFLSVNVSASNPEFLDTTPCTGFVPGYAGQPMTFTVTAFDADGGPVTLTVTGLPARAQMTPALPLSGNPVTSSFYWIPSEHDISYFYINYTATDSSGNQTVCNVFVDFALIHCQSIPDPYFISPTPSCGSVFSQVINENISFTVKTTIDSGGVYLDALGLPPGATMTPVLPSFGNTVTSIFSWTPASGQEGNHIVTFYSIDECGQQTTCSMSFDVVLPVELNSFVSSVSGNNVILNWATSSEENNFGFDIERSNVKGQTSDEWNKISFIQGHGTTISPNNYEFTDRDLNSGKYKFRLKQIDFNGNYKYYDLANEVVIGSPEKFELSQNYPNPFNPVTHLGFGISNSGHVSFKVYDVLGNEVKTLVNEIKPAGYYEVEFDGSNLPSGIYYYKIESGSFSQVKKMMLVK
jgi:hypothetical protein